MRDAPMHDHSKHSTEDFGALLLRERERERQRFIAVSVKRQGAKHRKLQKKSNMNGKDTFPSPSQSEIAVNNINVFLYCSYTIRAIKKTLRNRRLQTA